MTDSYGSSSLEVGNDIHYLSEHHSVVAFRLPDSVDRDEEDPDDDFYELSLNEIKKLYQELQETRRNLEEAPLLTKKLRAEMEEERAVVYSQALVRIEFPDRTVLQGVFSPSETVADVEEVVRLYVSQPDPIILFTAPPKVVLTSEKKLLDVGLVPAGKVYFKSIEHLPEGKAYLKDEVLRNLSSYQAAFQVAADARSRNTRKKVPEEKDGKTKKPKNQQQHTESASKLLKFLSKVPASSANMKTS